MDLQKIPPHDDEAEQAVLGCILTDKDAAAEAMEVLKSEDFYKNDNAIIYDAITTLYAKSSPIDIITLKDELTSMGKLDAVGGIEYLALLPDKVPTTANVNTCSLVASNAGILYKIGVVKAIQSLLSTNHLSV